MHQGLERNIGEIPHAEQSKVSWATEIGRRLTAGCMVAALALTAACTPSSDRSSGPVPGVGGSSSANQNPGANCNTASPKISPPSVSASLGDHALAMADPSVVGMSRKDLDTRFRQLDEAGAAGVRFDPFWRDIEKTEDDCQWGKYDQIVQTAVSHHKPVLAIIGQAPPWAAHPDCSPQARCAPKDIASYVQFAKDAVSHFAPQGVHDYELWNEPDESAYWNPTPDPVAYAQLVREACPAIKQIDPYAYVVTGGLALSSNIDFLQELLAADPGHCFDAVGLHLYSQSAFDQLPHIRQLMTEYGDGAKPIPVIATEFGVETSGDCGAVGNASEVDQAKVMEQFVTQWREFAGTGWAYWYTTTNVQAGNWGLFCADGRPKQPGLDEFKKLAETR